MDVDTGSDAESDAQNNADASTSADAGSDAESGAGSDLSFEFPSDIGGFDVIEIIVPRMGAASVSLNGEHAFLFSTLNEQKRAVLYDLGADPLDENAQRAIAFEKGVRGALSDRLGNTFLVFHSKLAGPPPANTTPADPEYIAHSWGISVVDIASAATRLVLSRHEPGQAVLYTPGDGEENGAEGANNADPKIFLIFKVPTTSGAVAPTRRDVLTINLRSFRTDTFRVPGLPEGIGLIPAAQRIYISQRHPQGRMTFVDVLTGARQTITGYQLNAGID